MIGIFVCMIYICIQTIIHVQICKLLYLYFFCIPILTVLNQCCFAMNLCRLFSMFALNRIKFPRDGNTVTLRNIYCFQFESKFKIQWTNAVNGCKISTVQFLFVESSTSHFLIIYYSILINSMQSVERKFRTFFRKGKKFRRSFGVERENIIRKFR